VEQGWAEVVKTGEPRVQDQANAGGERACDGFWINGCRKIGRGGANA